MKWPKVLATLGGRMGQHGGLTLLAGLALLACSLNDAVSGPAGTMRAFMQAAEARNTDGAYAVFAGDEVSRAEVEALVTENYVLFERFQDIKVDRWQVGSGNGGRGRLTGTVNYGDGHSGRFEAELVQRAGGWKLARVNIFVAKEKLQQFQTVTPSP